MTNDQTIAMMDNFKDLMDTFSQWTLPGIVLLILCWGYARKVPLYESFITGAKEGFGVAVTIIPYVVAILFAIRLFLASGIFADLKVGLLWLAAQFGFTGAGDSLELLPLALIRPLSGSGARGALAEVLATHGPDTFLGNTASIMMGSSETTFYILSVYYGAVQIKKFRHTLPACLIADACGLVIAFVLGVVLFG
jgi:spore maturation protein B